MAPLGILPFLAAGKRRPYQIEQSLRFDGSSALEFTPTSLLYNANQWTWSVWIKRGVLGAPGTGGRTILSVLQNATQYHKAYFYGNDGTDNDYLKTAPGNQLSDGLYRDPSAWYHLVVRKTGYASGDTVKWYINGVEVKSGAETYTGGAARFLIGASRNDSSNTRFFDGYMAEFHFVEGSSLAPTAFGGEDDNGVWRPKEFKATPRAQFPTYSSTYHSGWDANANNPTRSFDGNTEQGTNRSGAGNTAWSGSIDTSDGTTIRLRAALGASSSQVGSATDLVKVNNTDVTAKLKTAGAYTTLAWIDITTEAGDEITSLYMNAISGTSNPSIAAIDIDGEVVVDAESTGYGTNGFYLKFDETATNGIGHDYSGNGNNFTASGFTTSGPGTDVMSDTPTNNWCTWNPTDNTGVTLANGNLDFSGGSSNDCGGTVAVASGKWYWEIECRTDIGPGGQPLAHGIHNASVTSDFRHQAVWFYTDSTSSSQVRRYANNSNVAQVSIPASIRDIDIGDTLQVAYDADSGKVWFGVNNTWMDGSGGITGNPTSGSNPVFTLPDASIPMTPWRSQAGLAWEGFTNFGQREFAYPPGTSSATDYFNAVTYTGSVTDTSTQAVTGVGFQPDLVWIKRRDGNNSHQLVDVVRGTGKWLESNSVNDEDSTNTNGVLTSFDSDGFTLTGGSTNANLCCESGNTYVAWCWKAGGTAVSNTDGTLTSSVSANQDAGFSVVTYTGAASGSSTVGHGLGVPLDVYFVKSRNGANGAEDWMVYHSALGATKNVRLQKTDSAATQSTIWNDTEPTSSVFSIGTSNNVNGSNGTFVAYCFAEKTGVSKFGSYSGTGATQFIECGFKPALVIMKSSANAREWIMKDTARGDDKTLETHEPNSESASETVGYQSNPNGFTLVGSSVANTSGDTLIFMAFAENFSADTAFKSLNTANLPTPEIKDGSDYFDTVLWTGNQTARTISLNSTFTPDFIWIKNRTSAYNHSLQDVARGFGASTKLACNVTNPENSTNTEPQAGYVDSVAAGSFDIDASATATWYHNNLNSNNYVAWNWLAGGSTSSNTDGSITSAVSANLSAGFSIVSYTGDATATPSVGHGLGVVPDMIIIKNRGSSTGWRVWHSAVHTTSGNTKTLALNANNASFTSTQIVSGCNSTTFSLKDGSSDVNNHVNGPSTRNYVAYCFAEVEGYSKFGSYTGNGNASGPFVWCGFKPAWLLIKRTGGADNWFMYDTARDEYNQAYRALDADTADLEKTSATIPIDILSNGFKIRSSGTAMNGSGETIIFAAFSENPFGGDGVSPATAR